MGNPAMMRKMLSIVTLLAIPALWGCQTSPVSVPPFGVSEDYQVLAGQPGRGLVADPNSPIPDVPKPIGFKPVVAQSSAASDGRARTVHHVYQGMGGSGEVVTLYQRTLPSKGWRFTGQRSLAEGGTVLTYTKGPEDLQIATRQSYRATTITVDITPQGVAPRPPATASQPAPQG